MKRPNSFEILRNFQEDRPVMKEANQDVDFLIHLLLQEVMELQQEPNDGMSREKYLEQETADVAIFAIQILDVLTGDAQMAINEKVARNSVKYPAILFQSGDYEEARRKSKEQWTQEDNRNFYAD